MHQNAPFPLKSQKIFCVGRNTEMKHSTQYNIRLLQSAKIAPMQNLPKRPIFHSEVKTFSGRGHSPSLEPSCSEEGETPK